MRDALRAAMWVVFAVLVAVALSMGAFAVAGGSVGRPAAPVRVVPSDDDAHETTPSMTPKPSKTPEATETPNNTTSQSPAQTATQSPTETRSENPSESHSESPSAEDTPKPGGGDGHEGEDHDDD